MRRRQRPVPLWKLPAVCEHCGAAVGPELASDPEPRCRFCREPLPREALAPSMPAGMQALLERTTAINEGLQAILAQETAGQGGLAEALARRTIFGSKVTGAPAPPVPGAPAVPSAPPLPGPPAVAGTPAVPGGAPVAPPADLGEAPGAQWLSVAPGAWWRWSWFDGQWQPAPPADGCPAPSPQGWMRWVETLDGQWSHIESGAEGAPWPTPAAR